MAPAEITAIFTGIASLVASAVAAMLSWRAATNAAEAKKEAIEAKLKSDALLKEAADSKVEVAKIHTLTNDAASKASAALAVANETIRGLELLNASLAAGKPPVSSKPL